MLHSIFTYAKEHLNLKTMIYFSDHAEDMVYYHGTSGFSYDMIRIPFWIYLSPDYRKIHPDILPALQSNKDKILPTIFSLKQRQASGRQRQIFIRTFTICPLRLMFLIRKRSPCTGNCSLPTTRNLKIDKAKGWPAGHLFADHFTHKIPASSDTSYASVFS